MSGGKEACADEASSRQARQVHFEGAAASNEDMGMGLTRSDDTGVAQRLTVTKRLSTGIAVAMAKKSDRYVAWVFTFHVVSLLTFFIKGVAVIILDYAPVVLPRDSNISRVGGIVLWVTFALGCALGAGPVVAKLGPKWALISGLALLDVAYVLFGICAFTGPCFAQWPLFLTSNFVEGVGAALFLTAICVYMARVSKVLAAESPLETESQLLANLGGTIGAWSLITEVFFKLATSGMEGLHLPMKLIIAGWVVVAVLCTGLLCLTRELPAEEEEAKKGWASEVASFFELWRDPVTWLIGFTNYTFAFSDTLITNKMDPEFLVPMLGDSAIGICTAVASLSGALLAKPYGFLGAHLGKNVPLAIGSVSFALVPLLIRFTSLPVSGGWAIVVIFVLQGSGRAVQEGVNRALYADFFMGPLLDSAFANYNFQMATMSAVGNLFQTFATLDLLVLVTVLLAGLILPSYLMASAWRRRVERKAAGGDEDAASSESTMA